MESLKLNKFKAFNDELSIQLDKKNLLLYGENGAGKSSLYESIKVSFYYQKINDKITASTPEEEQQLRADFWSRYNNKITNEDFGIELNGVPYNSFGVNDYRAYFISFEELKIEDGIYLKDLIRKFHFPIDDIDALCTPDFIGLLQDEVNSKLELFNEPVKIEIEEQDNYALLISDNNKNITSKTEIKKFFNEAKINAILLLVLLTVVQLSKETGKKNILVLDDFITSLDASNRSFLFKLILEDFQDMQILIFTHNISFYNLAMFMIKNILPQSNEWLFGNIYEINNVHKIYFKKLIEKVEDIKADFIGLNTPHSQAAIDSIGNRMRKKFEILLYEFSKLSMIGAVEDSSKIIDRILTEKPVYYNSKLTASDLVDKLQMVLNQNIPFNLTGRLQSKINEFKNDDFSNFCKIVKELKLYQKITLHPLSHGVAGMPTFTVKEIEKSLDLLEKMEEYLKDMVDNNVNAI